MKILYSIILIYFWIYLLCPQLALSQSIEVLSVTDGDIIEESFKSPRYDSNGNKCAVVHIVGLESTGFEFEGNIVEIIPSYQDFYLYVPSGTKRIKVKHRDYWPIEIDFRSFETAIRGGNYYKVELKCSTYLHQNINMPLLTKKTSISVSIRPFGSSVILDGKSIGETPIVIEKIKRGNHKIQISYPNYVNYDTIVTVEKGVMSQVNGLLTPIVDVVFKTNAIYATVWENGIELGKTDYPIKLVAGSHIVKLTARNHYCAVDTIFVSPENKKFDVYMPKKYIDNFNLELGQIKLPMKVSHDSVNGDFYSYNYKYDDPTSILRRTKLYDPSDNTHYAIDLSLLSGFPIYREYPNLILRDLDRKVQEMSPFNSKETSSHKMLLSGIQYFTNKKYFEAYRRFRRAWELAGEKHPMEVLSALNWICNDAFLNISDEEAANKYKSMAVLGINDAVYVMGWLYENGIFVQKDLEKAREYYIRSALDGNLSALWSLAWFYERGIACKKSLEMAYSLYSYSEEKLKRISSTEDILDLHFAIEKQIVNNYSMNELFARGISGQEERKKSYLNQAAILGNVKAMLALNETFWTKTAAYLGNEEARLRTAKLQVSNLEIVKKMLEDLTNKGKACEILGIAYGLNNIDSCIYWLKKAVELDDIDAVFYLENAEYVKVGRGRCIISFDERYEFPVQIYLNGHLSDWEKVGDSVDIDLYDGHGQISYSQNWVSKEFEIEKVYKDGHREYSMQTWSYSLGAAFYSSQ